MKNTPLMIAVFSLIFLSACSNKFPEQIKVSTRPVEKPLLALPAPDPIQTRPIVWKIITPDNYQQVFEELAQSGNVQALIGLTGTGYENLSLNLNDLRTYVQQQEAIIVAYRRYYESNR